MSTTAYRYKAINDAGEVVEGALDGESEDAVAAKLQASGFMPIRIDSGAGGRLRDLLSIEIFPSRQSLSRKEVMLVTRELATLMNAQLELEKTLEILQSLTESNRAKAILSRILDDVRGGDSLADALANHPDSFSPLYVSMVRAGEAGGDLEGVFTHLTAYLEQMDAVREETQSALIYPAILALTTCGAVLVLIGFVLPRFKPLFESAGDKLPFVTKVVMTIGDFVDGYWWLLSAACLALALTIRALLRSPGTRSQWDNRVIRMPWIGDVLRKIETARLVRTLGTLLTNGVPMLSALEIARETINNGAFKSDLVSVIASVKEGKRLSEEMENQELLPGMASQLLRVGEESGQLEAMLIKMAEIYDHEVQRSIRRFLAILTPALTVFLGILIAGVIVSILVAILSVNEIAF